MKKWKQLFLFPHDHYRRSLKAVLWFSLSSSLSQPVVQQCLMRAPVPLIPPALDCGWMLAQGWWTVMATNDFLTAAPDSRVQWYSLHGVTMPYCLIPPWIHLKCMLMNCDALPYIRYKTYSNTSPWSGGINSVWVEVQLCSVNVVTWGLQTDLILNECA